MQDIPAGLSRMGAGKGALPDAQFIHWRVEMPTYESPFAPDEGELVFFSLHLLVHVLSGTGNAW